MPEVFAISGAFGQPEGWVVTPKGNYGAPREGCPVDRQIGKEGCRHPAAIKLQTGLRQLGKAVSVDGFIGPKTAAAVNSALGVQLSPEQVAAQATFLSIQVLEKMMDEGGPKTVGPPKDPTITPVPGTDDRVTKKPLPLAGWALVGLSAVIAGTGVWFIGSDS